MNFRRILSKVSLQSSTSSRKSDQSEEIAKLQKEIESLKINVSSLKVLLENRDAAIGTLAREKEKLYIELKNVQRINRKIQQQLIDEREMHSKEKDFLIQNVKRLSEKREFNEFVQRPDTSERYIETLQNELLSKDEVICNLCSKYLKLKKYKTSLQKRNELLHKYNEMTCENIISILKENKKSLDSSLNNLLLTPTTSSSHLQYYKLLKINASLIYDKTELKLRLLNIKNQVHGENKLSAVVSSSKTCQSEKVLEMYTNI